MGDSCPWVEEGAALHAAHSTQLSKSGADLPRTPGIQDCCATVPAEH